MRLERWLKGVACCLLAAGAAASAADVLDGELALWVDDTGAELGETLSRHPRFKGETLRLVTLAPGAGDGRSNELAQAVERRLRQRLLAVEGVRLAVEAPRHDCELPPAIDYLVRIEVAAAGRRDGRVHVAVVDVAESVWVSGISHEWQGRLSAPQRAALAAPVNRARPGSAGAPIPLEQAGDVAAALQADLACTLPRDLSGGVYVAIPEAAALSRVGLALQGELMFEALAAVTPDRDQARWVLSVEADDSAPGAGADVRELSLTLADAEGGRRQRLASVFVSGVPGSAPPDPPPAVADTPAPLPAEPDPAPAADPAGLLSVLNMRPARAEGICDARKARMNTCVEISFELLEPAYLFVVSTRDHQVSEAPCDAGLRRAEAGARRYRLRVPPGSYALEAGDTGPDAGFYVLAARERRVAQPLADALSGAPGQCRNEAEAADWLGELQRVLESHGDRVSWRALHVAHDTDGIVAL